MYLTREVGIGMELGCGCKLGRGRRGNKEKVLEEGRAGQREQGSAYSRVEVLLPFVPTNVSNLQIDNYL